MFDMCIQVDTGARQKVGVMFSHEFGLTGLNGLLRALGVAWLGCILLAGIVHAQAPQQGVAGPAPPAAASAASPSAAAPVAGAPTPAVASPGAAAPVAAAAQTAG